ncbi:MAG: TetR family transcriptional regulator [Ruminococcus bromii]|nr:TetR family transcriptional regulator [Ruminococcus bromii]
MPKVTQEHREQMRARILEAAVKASEIRPAYELTMRDVIRSAKLSPGAVYSYYRNIDDLWIDFFNSRSRVADAVPGTERGAGEPLGAYMDRLLDAVALSLREITQPVGKIIFELDTKRATHPEFARRRSESVKPLIFYHEALSQLEQAIRADMEVGALPPDTDVKTALVFLQTSFDGILRDLIFERCYGLKKTAPIDETKLIAALAKSLRALLNIQGE